MTTTNTASFNSPVAPSLAKAWLVIICASLFFFYEFVQMTMFSSINADLMAAFNTTATRISNLSACYFYADVLFLFPAGIILDRFSTRKIIVGAMSLCTAATIIFSFANTYELAMVMRLLSGVGAAFCFLSALRLATRWFLPAHLALVTGVIVTMAMLGGMVGQAPISILVQNFGWRHTVFADGCLGIIFILVILWQVRDFPHGSHTKENGQELLQKLGFWQSIFSAWSNSQNWLAGFYTSFINLPILVLGALWGTEFLVQVHHLSQTQASTVNMMLFFGFVIGSPILGWWSDHLGRRKLPMLLCAILSIITILVIMYSPNLTFWTSLLLFFILGFISSGQIIGYPLIAESNPNCLIGTATGWAAVLIMGGGAFGQPLFGWLLDLHWNGLKINNVPTYTAADYHFAWLIFPIMFIIAFFMALLARETYCKAYANN
jgi:MFS family permease